MLDFNKIYNLLPAVYRIRDAELALQFKGALEPGEWAELQSLLAIQGSRSADQQRRLDELQDKRQRGPLKALMAVIAEQVEVLEASLQQAYDDQFIETCQEWVVPYIGDLVGVSGLHEFPNAPFSNRALVANTLAYRQRKGTVSVLEQIARDVTGWDANVVEYFQVLATTQYMDHIRAGNLSVASIRGAEKQLLNTPFDRYARTLDVRNIESGRGKYNIPNIGIFLWRIQNFSITHAPAFMVDARRFRFDPIGRDIQLYTRRQTEQTITQLSGPLNVPMPIGRRRLNSNLNDYYGKDSQGALKSIFLEFDIAGSPPPSVPVTACDLSDKGGGWAHQPDDSIGIDPVLGRIAFPSNLPPPDSLFVNYEYGFSAPMGGGEYERKLATAPITIRVPQDAPTIQQGINLAISRLAGSEVSATVEIEDSAYYFETPTVAVPAGKNIELRAANGHRPVLAMSGDFVVTGKSEAAFTINGLLVSGGNLLIPAKDSQNAPSQIRHVQVTHCTWSPAATPAIGPALPHGPTQLRVDADDVVLLVDHSITGAVRARDTATVSLCSSIVDSQASTSVAYSALDNVSAGAPLTTQNTTIIGKVHALRIDLASNTIFFAELAEGDAWNVPVNAEQIQQGCVRFSYVPPQSHVPRKYRCHPAASDAGVVRPEFASLRFGDAGYCQLEPASGSEITEGADDQAEMGAFHDLFQPQRTANLRGSLQEYLRFGLQAGIFFAS